MNKLFVGIVLMAIVAVLYGKYGDPLLWRIQAWQEEKKEQGVIAPSIVEPILPPPPVWTLEDAGEKEGIPYTRVSLSYNNHVYPLDTYAGPCFLIEESSGWEFLPNEETGLICYYAGGGVELGVFNRNGVRTIEQGAIEEPTAESEGVRGNFSVIKAL